MQNTTLDFLYLLYSSIASHVAVCFLLARQRALHPYYFGRSLPYRPTQDHRISEWLHRGVGLLSAGLTLMLPYAVSDTTDPLQQCGLRVACFFYVCKVLDLALIKAHRPPTRMVPDEKGDMKPASMKGTWDYVVYAWLLLTEMRYHSFDIVVEQRTRPSKSIISIQHPSYQHAWTMGPLLIIPTIAYFFPSGATKCAALLVFMQHQLAAVHFAFHPRCPYPLFYLPFSASTMSDFWTTHWHASASSFLQSLAYKPVRKATGSRAAGVLAAFCLSGLWHGWASAPLATRPWLIGVEVWALFMSFGVACLIERWIWGKRQGGLVQRVCVWAYALGGAGICWSTLECYSKVELLRNPTCGP